MFLVALSLWVSQLYALTRRTAWMIFASSRSQVSVAPSATTLAKNEQEDHCPDPIVILVWITYGLLHFPCPVLASSQFMKVTSQASCDCLFVWSISLASCTKKHTAQVACKVTDAMNLGKHPAFQDIRRIRALFNYICCCLEDHGRRF